MKVRGNSLIDAASNFRKTQSTVMRFGQILFIHFYSPEKKRTMLSFCPGQKVQSPGIGPSVIIFILLIQSCIGSNPCSCQNNWLDKLLCRPLILDSLHAKDQSKWGMELSIRKGNSNELSSFNTFPCSRSLWMSFTDIRVMSPSVLSFNSQIHSNNDIL